MRADLHTHTTASDGLDAPEVLVQRANDEGLDAIAIADHDTVDAHLQLKTANIGILLLIPAIEMSANVGANEVHVLGYFIQVEDVHLADRLRDLREQRLVRIERFCTRLTRLGLPLTLDEVLVHASGDSAGRPHIARAMIGKGYVASVGEAFDRYLSGGRPAFVPREDVTPEWSIDLIHSAGGAAVLAHPYTTGNPAQTTERLLPHGLDGIEVRYGVYDDVQRTYLQALADRFSLVPTGGSDYHGAEHREDAPLGSGWVEGAVVSRLEAAAQRYR